MPAERIKKTNVFERAFKCQTMDKKNAIRFESVLNSNTIKVYTDGSKLYGRVDAVFMQNTQTTHQNKHFSTLENIALGSRQKS